jgi:predicted RNA-binding Zn-ribbon protein involved in translation (DUF1610 family)
MWSERTVHEWQRAQFDTKCGSCGEPIAVGAPLFVISLAFHWTKFRCPACAWQPVPEDLPALPPEAVARAERIEGLRRSALLKLTGQGSLELVPMREVGEEG